MIIGINANTRIKRSIGQTLLYYQESEILKSYPLFLKKIMYQFSTFQDISFCSPNKHQKLSRHHCISFRARDRCLISID